MKRAKLIKHLNEHNCILKREGAAHSIFANRLTGIKTTVPRHADIGDFLANEICKQLGIPKIC